MRNTIQPLVDEAEMTGWRRDLHRMPELGFTEHRTAAYVAGLCRDFGLAVETGIGGTGIVATLDTGKPGPILGIRAELDALPITESVDRDWSSETPGVSHACGHDGHMAILLGAARALTARPPATGAVRFIFQPAEEGLGGAKAMLDDDLFTRFPCDEIYALHNSDAPLGQIVVHHGVVAAAADQFDITLRGTGGHAAEPHRTRNPLPAAARILLAVESLPARITDARHPCVVTVGALNGGHAFNVIPTTAFLTGTVRALHEPSRAAIEAAIRRITAAEAAAEGLEVELTYTSSFAVTENRPEQADHAIAAARELFGEDRVTVDPPPEMGSEDFSFMLHQRPGCYLMLGQRDDDHHAQCHDAAYDFNDRALVPGAALWVRLAERRLGAGG